MSVVLKELFQELIPITLTILVVIGATLGLYALLNKRYAAKWRCLVWAAIALRLLIPVNPSLSAEPLIYLPVPAQQELTMQILDRNSERQETAATPSDNGETPAASGIVYADSLNENPMAEAVPPVVKLDVMKLAAWIWFGGMVAFALFHMGVHLKFRLHIKRYGHYLYRGRITDKLAALKGEYRIKRTILPVVCGELSSPMVTGFFHPILALPMENYSDTELDVILRHELTHLKKHHLPFKLLLLAAQIMHWFNPIVYVMNAFANRDIELACDDAVLRGKGSDYRKEYSAALLSTMKKTLRRGGLQPVMMTSLDGGKGKLMGRFQNIFNDKKKKRGILALIAILLIVAVAGSFIVFGTRGVEQTNEGLTIWKSAYMSSMDDLLVRFQRGHPELNMTIEDYSDLSDEDFQRKLKTELLAGKGPDVVFLDRQFSQTADLQKMMRAGAFADMEAEFQADTQYKAEAFNQSVMNAGMVDGKRYLVPLFYRVPVVLSTQEKLDLAGINAANCTDYFGFAEEIDRFMQTEQGASGKMRVFDDTGIFKNMYEMMGINFMDYETQTFDFSMPEAKRATELYKNWYKQDGFPTTVPVQAELPWISEPSVPWVFHDYFMTDQFTILFGNYSYLQAHATPVVIPIRNLDGGVSAEIGLSAAVSNNSKNKQNAYTLLQYLLSDTVQVKRWNFGIPVKNDCFIYEAEKSLDHYTISNAVIEYAMTEAETRPIPEETVQELFQITQDVTNVYFITPINGEIYTIMRDYWDGKASYEQCAERVQQRYGMYISE